jgi:hypothetical protein
MNIVVGANGGYTSHARIPSTSVATAIANIFEKENQKKNVRNKFVRILKIFTKTNDPAIF